MTREEAINLIRTWNPIHPLKKEAIEVAINAMKQPQIVRCNDCKFHKKSIKGKGYCDGPCDVLGYVDGDWFCGDGKPREDGEQ